MGLCSRRDCEQAGWGPSHCVPGGDTATQDTDKDITQDAGPRHRTQNTDRKSPVGSKGCEGNCRTAGVI